MLSSRTIKVYNSSLTETLKPTVELKTELSSLSSQLAEALKQNKELRSELIRTQTELLKTREELKLVNQQNALLDSRLKELEKQLNMNSSNSGLPPSIAKVDPRKTPKKTKSLRKKSDKKVGGQPGHKGETLEFSQTPDKTVILDVDTCTNCGKSLDLEEVDKTIKRQVFEMPEPKVEVTEYQANVKICTCGHRNVAPFPEGVTNYVQYGSKLTTFATYLLHYQMIPFKRIMELFEDLFSFQISQGTLVTMSRRVSESLKKTENFIKQQLIGSTAVHFDETGCYVGKERHWLHTASTDEYTHQAVHVRRGSEAMRDIGILPFFKGTAIHDSWSSYFTFDDCNHSLCNAHHLRELEALKELYKQPWVSELSRVLLDAYHFSLDNEYPLSEQKCQEFIRRFRECLAEGHRLNPPLPIPPGKKKAKKTAAQRFLARMEKRETEIFRFLFDEDVPFDNNCAERDIRMTKVKQKVSGTFRTSVGADDFARIRSVISTLKKQNKGVLSGLTDAFIRKVIPVA